MTQTVAIALLCTMLSQTKPVAPQKEATAVDPNTALKREVKDVNINTTLEEALSQCEQLAGVKIVVDWKALEGAGIKPAAEVSIKAAVATVAKLLKMTLAGVAGKDDLLISYVDEDVVRVTTRAAMVRQIRVARAMVGSQKPKARQLPGQFDMEEIPLSDVIDFIREASGVNFHVNWKALNTVGVGKGTPVTLQATGISFAKALDLVTDQLATEGDKLQRVYWVIDDGIVKISTGQVFNEQVRTKVYDVADLLMVIPDFESPRMDLARRNDNTSTSQTDSQARSIWEPSSTSDQKKEENMADKRKKAEENLVEIVKSTIGQDMWQEGGGKGTVRLIGKKLVVSQTLLGFKLMEQAIQPR